AVTGVQECLAEKLLENLGAGPNYHVFSPGRDSEFFPHEFRGFFAKRREAGRRAVMRLILANRLLAGGFRRGCTLKWAIADFEFDNILPLALEGPGDSQDCERRFNIQV